MSTCCVVVPHIQDTIWHSSNAMVYPGVACCVACHICRGATRGDTRRSALANDDGFTTVTRRKSSFVNMKKPVIGTRSHGNTLKVSSGRFISIFASRLDPSVSCDALSAYINDVHSINANCEQLITKYNTYASFKVDVTCNDMSTFLHPDKWPQGGLPEKVL